MPLGFRKIGHLPDEAERLREVPELERALNPPLVLNTPLGRLRLMSSDFLRRNAAEHRHGTVCRISQLRLRRPRPLCALLRQLPEGNPAQPLSYQRLHAPEMGIVDAKFLAVSDCLQEVFRTRANVPARRCDPNRDLLI